MSLREPNKWLPQAWFKYGHKIRWKRNVCMIRPSGIRSQKGKMQATFLILPISGRKWHGGGGVVAWSNRKRKCKKPALQHRKQRATAALTVGDGRAQSLWQPIWAPTPLCSAPCTSQHKPLPQGKMSLKRPSKHLITKRCLSSCYA